MAEKPLQPSTSRTEPNKDCVLAALGLLFSIFFAMMLLVVFKDCDSGIPVRFRADGNVFNLRRLQARTKTFIAMIRDLLYADDCALLAHSEAEAQQLQCSLASTQRPYASALQSA